MLALAEHPFCVCFSRHVPSQVCLRLLPVSTLGKRSFMCFPSQNTNQHSSLPKEPLSFHFSGRFCRNRFAGTASVGVLKHSVWPSHLSTQSYACRMCTGSFGFCHHHQVIGAPPHRSHLLYSVSMVRSGRELRGGAAVVFGKHVCPCPPDTKATPVRVLNMGVEIVTMAEVHCPHL